MKGQHNGYPAPVPSIVRRLWSRHAQLVRYGAVGLASLAIYVGFSAVMHRLLSIDAVVANSSGYLFATGFNYCANFYWAFASVRPHTEALWRFGAVAALGVGLNAIYAAAMVNWSTFSVEAIAISFALGWPFVSFIALRFWAFGDSSRNSRSK